MEREVQARSSQRTNCHRLQIRIMGIRRTTKRLFEAYLCHKRLMSQEGASKPLTQGCFDLAILRYSLHFALESRGPNGRRTEHQNGRGVPLEGHPTPIVAMTYIIKILQVEGLALKLRGTPGISLVLWWFCCVQVVSNN